jgi:predicted dinucleotide-binding enzyme
MNIAVLGTGTVGQTLSSKLLELGHKVLMGTRSVSETKTKTAKDGYGNPAELMLPIWLRVMTVKHSGAFNFKVVS